MRNGEVPPVLDSWFRWMLVTCLPAQAVTCRLAGLLAGGASTKKSSDHHEKDAAAATKLLEEQVRDQKFRVRVESLTKEGVCLVQASTLDRPPVSINRRVLEALARPQQLSLGSTPVELLITHFHSTNAFYGQPRYRYRIGCHKRDLDTDGCWLID